MAAPPLPDLPVREALPALRQALRETGQAVLSAPPGSGKTTLVPLVLRDEPWLADRAILMLEPRRLAARASAARMAHLLGETVGETVGYQIRFERRRSARTRIEVVTEGLLTRRLQEDPELPGVGLVIFDEFHERSLNADLALALTLDARANLNPELRILVMSATLDSERVADLLGGAPVVRAAGRMYPVAIRHRPPSTQARLEEAVSAACLDALREEEGDVLAFLPGAREIRQAQRRIEERARGGLRVLPLYGDLSSAEQDEALRPAPAGTRKIILATNIAQTSLTVEGITTVVDSGYARVARYDRASAANRLETQRISRAAADQRAGRAGRLRPGVCYRLWSEEQHGRLPAQDQPEILSTDLSRFALELLAWGIADPRHLPFLDLPGAADWEAARGLLQRLEAVDGQGRITAHGRAMLRLPVAPRLAHMLLRAKASGQAHSAAWVAAALEAPDAAPGADLASHLHTLRAAGPGAGRVRESVRQLLRLVQGDEQRAPEEDDLGRLLAWAYPERIARRREGQRGVFLCVDGSEARVAEGDALAGAEWLAIAHWDPEPPRRVRLAAPLTEDDVRRDLSTAVERQVHVVWNEAEQAVFAEEQSRLGALVLRRRPLREGHEQAIRDALIEGLRGLGLSVLPWTDGARSWQARVLSLKRWRPGEDWPDVSDEGLLARLQDWLAPHLEACSRRDHLGRLDLQEILEQQLDYAQQQRLARLAPTHLPVPSGSRIPLEYFADGRAPVLAVKLQEVFGLLRTPAVNEGRTPVVLHLLSPAQRPLAVTQDLESFWAQVYPEVRKEMRGRYPRHPWPEDPVQAVPTRRAKPRV